MICFNLPHLTGSEEKYLQQAIQNRDLSGGNQFNILCEKWLKSFTNAKKVLLTASCTQALEYAALICNIRQGDEIIMPSYTFVSSANAFVLRGASIVFVDIDPETMNINANLIESAISQKTKAILIMHYGGMACDMDRIMEVARSNNLIVIEDAAHCIGAYDKNNRHLGSIGDIGVISFHSTKNVHCGEGGAVLINNPKYLEIADYVRDKGTDRIDFLAGKIKSYSWVCIGSNYWLNELSAAFLYAQLLEVCVINATRRGLWEKYRKGLSESGFDGKFFLREAHHNGHIYYIKCQNSNERQVLIEYMKAKDIACVSHYEPLHSSSFGRKAGVFNGKDQYTTIESSRLLRLPLYPDLKEGDQEYIIHSLLSFRKTLK